MCLEQRSLNQKQPLCQTWVTYCSVRKKWLVTTCFARPRWIALSDNSDEVKYVVYHRSIPYTPCLTKIWKHFENISELLVHYVVPPFKLNSTYPWSLWRYRSIYLLSGWSGFLFCDVSNLGI